MILLKLFTAFAFFSTLLMGCQTPFIDIDISGQTAGPPPGPAAGCGGWYSVCPGAAKIGQFQEIIKIGDPPVQEIYVVKHRTDDGIAWNVEVPPAKVEGGPFAPNQLVEIGSVSGRVIIRKVE